jgi:hypothetical protein
VNLEERGDRAYLVMVIGWFRVCRKELGNAQERTM